MRNCRPKIVSGCVRSGVLFRGAVRFFRGTPELRDFAYCTNFHSVRSFKEIIVNGQLCEFQNDTLVAFSNNTDKLAGLGIGLGAVIQKMGNINYLLFLASGLIVTSAMFTNCIIRNAIFK